MSDNVDVIIHLSNDRKAFVIKVPMEQVQTLIQGYQDPNQALVCVASHDGTGLRYLAKHHIVEIEVTGIVQ